MRRELLCAALLALLFALAPPSAPAQQGGAPQSNGGNVLEGDLKIDESKADGMKPLTFEVILYALNRNVLGRQSVPSNGHFRFLNVGNGQYDIAVEMENVEVARVRVEVNSTFRTDFHRDIELEWRPGPAQEKRGGAGLVSTAEVYKRTPPNQSLFEKAQEAMDKKKYSDAAALLRQLVGSDAQDYQAWTELGTAHLLLNDAAEAEKSYLRAIEIRPAFTLAYLDLARLRMAQKNYDGAVEILTRAVALQPPSADANFLLGESYLQLKKGSKAVPYLEEAARLGRLEAHLRLATLYNAAGLKDRAASEYEQFLAARPDYPERKKLEQYIKENKKQ
jgi:Flp pilus assembly protein TadD